MRARIEAGQLYLDGLTLDEGQLIVEAIAARRAYYERQAAASAAEARDNQELLEGRKRGKTKIERLVGECEAEAAEHRDHARMLADLQRAASPAVDLLLATEPGPAA
jgi:hypothetical protein